MPEEHTGQERTERATPKRRREARQQGQVPRSRELNTMVMMLASSLGLLFTGEGMVGRLSALTERSLDLERTALFEPEAMILGLASGVKGALILVAPFFVIVSLAALMGPLGLGGWLFSIQTLGFKWERLNPVSGLKRVFNWAGLAELLKALAKFLLLWVVALFVFRAFSEEFLHLGTEGVHGGLAHGTQLLLGLFLALSCTLVLFAALDVPIQLWTHARKLRMTRQEIREELKETEGNPELRGRVRSMQRELAKRRMMQEVPKADVVVVNPTHYAVALRYEQAGKRAPEVVAKGMDQLALGMREVANRHGVPIFAAPVLARALHYSTELGQSIPAGLYVAVAKVLAYVYQVKSVARNGGVMPEQPIDLSVPEEFLRGHKR